MRFPSRALPVRFRNRSPAPAIMGASEEESRRPEPGTEGREAPELIDAVIFDTDGALVQTERMRARASARAAIELRPDGVAEDEVGAPGVLAGDA